jgi:hypothetical protein
LDPLTEDALFVVTFIANVAGAFMLSQKYEVQVNMFK